MTILDRYEVHKTTMDIVRASKKTSEQIAKTELQIEKLNKKLKIQQEKVTELQKDEILMLQDLSTYGCASDEHINIGKKCEKQMKLIEKWKQQ